MKKYGSSLSGEQPVLAHQARRWRFGSIVLDERRHELSVDGRVVEIDPKPLGLLIQLLEHADSVGTKDALMRAVWPGRIVEEAALAKAIGRLREAIGDRDQQIIRTHYGYGYRFGAAVQVEQLDRTPSRSAADAERRVLTVLFCDVVGSTELIEVLDGETFREILLDYQQRVTEVCQRYGGHLAQRMGDGALLYFGYPAAHDDDAERAVRCGCELIRTIPRAVEQGTRVSIRVAAHTGTVVIGLTGGAHEILATGPSVHIASRLQSLAPPDTLLISDATFRLVRGLFVPRDFGLQELRGFSDPLRVHQVLQPSGVRSRLEAAPSLSPFVGRGKEIERIQNGWRDAVNGKGNALLIRGDPGLGKSRLLLELRDRLSDSAYTWLECRATTLNRNSAYFPLVELMRRGLALREDDSDAEKMRRLERALETLGIDPAETAPFLAPLLNLALMDRYAPPQLGVELHRRRTLAALTGWILRLAERQPLVIVFEDLHWADESSIACMDALAQALADRPVLLLMTARPEFVARREGAAPESIVLDPLAADDSSRLLEALTASMPLAPALCELVLQRSAGVPLFVEELTRALMESGELVERDGQLHGNTLPTWLAIPESLQGLLMARLDRLGTARDVVQIAAAVGRECPLRLLELVVGPDRPDLHGDLRQLREAGILFERAANNDVHYAFRHALIQEAAYDTLLRARRRSLHGQIAAAMETAFSERLANEPEVFALHLEKAGLIGRAIEFYARACERAVAAGSYSDAILHAEHALSLIPALESDAPKSRIELDLLLRLGEGKIVLMGRGHPALDPILERCDELLPEVDDFDLRARALGNLGLTRMGSGHFLAGIDAGQQLLHIAERCGNRAYEGAGRCMIAMNAFWAGDLLLYERHGRGGLREYDESVTRGAGRLVGQWGVFATLGYAPMTLWISGLPEQALLLSAENAARAVASGDPWALSLEHARRAGFLRFSTADPIRMGDTALAGAEIAERCGFEEAHVANQLFFGISQIMRGDWHAGYALSVRMMEARRTRRTRYGEPVFWAFIGESCLDAGRVAEAEAALEAAERSEAQFGPQLYDAGVMHLRGRILEASGMDDAAVDACFEKAIEIANRRSARMLELCAATSLARRWMARGRADEAKSLLKPIYDGFTEGFDTPELRAAAAILSEAEPGFSRKRA